MEPIKEELDHPGVRRKRQGLITIRPKKIVNNNDSIEIIEERLTRETLDRRPPEKLRDSSGLENMEVSIKMEKQEEERPRQHTSNQAGDSGSDTSDLSVAAAIERMEIINRGSPYDFEEDEVPKGTEARHVDRDKDTKKLASGAARQGSCMNPRSYMDRSNPLKGKPNIKATTCGDDTLVFKEETPTEKEEGSNDDVMKEIDDFLNSGEEEGKGKPAGTAFPNYHCCRKPGRTSPEVKPLDVNAESERLYSNDFYYEHCFLNLDQDGDQNERPSTSHAIYSPKNLLPTPSHPSTHQDPQTAKFSTPSLYNLLSSVLLSLFMSHVSIPSPAHSTTRDQAEVLYSM